MSTDPRPGVSVDGGPGDPLFVDRDALQRTAERLRGAPLELRERGRGLGLLWAHRLIVGLARLGRAADERLFPRYREREIEAPVFIVAAPRSGTTFLYRLMALDDRFAHLKLYETLLPSVSLIRLLRRLDRLDRGLGRPMRWCVRRLERKVFGGWRHVHRVRFDRAEEDEGLFLLTLLSPALYLLNDRIDRLRRPGYVDELEERTRERLAAYYRDSLTRILEAKRASGPLLMKSVLVGGRVRTVRRVFPEGRFIHLVRHPYRSIPSFVSMFRTAWRGLFPSMPAGDARGRRLGELAVDYYLRLHRACRELGSDRRMTIRFGELVDHPEETLERVYRWLGRPLREDHRRAVRGELAAASRRDSRHQYSLEASGLSREEIAARLDEVFSAYGFRR